MKKMYLVMMKSEIISLEGKEALLIPMEFDKKEIEGVEKKVIHNAMMRDARKLYPQYVGKKTSFSITELSRKEYNYFKKHKVYKQHSKLLENNELQGKRVV